MREAPSSETGREDLVDQTASGIGVINSDPSLGADVTACEQLNSNENLCAVGFKTIGAGFIVDAEQASTLGLGRYENLTNHIRPYINGRDLASRRRGIFVLDFFGLSEDDLRRRYPECYQHLLNRVKPERLLNRNRIFRESWWVIGHPRPVFRSFTSGLQRFIATIETSRHRFFVFLPIIDAPDSTLVTFGLADAWFLGTLSSRVHVVWALAAGGRLGVGNDPRYNKTRCFETFPFPEPSESLKSRIRQLGEDLDAHRKQRQALHPTLTITGMYNVLERLRRGEPLDPKERIIHEQGLVSILRQIHDALDTAVLAAYGWSDLTAPLLTSAPGSEQAEAIEETILQRLVALNTERATEERRGLIRWLRPDFQHPGQAADDMGNVGTGADTADTQTIAAGPKRDWPRTLPDQFLALRAALAARPGPLTAPELAQGFTRAPRAKVSELLEILVILGHARRLDDGRYLPG